MIRTRRTFLSLLCIALFLPGCIMLSDGPEIPQPNDARYDDASIKTEIASALLRSNPAKANTVSVQCFKGHVFLIGEADSVFSKEAFIIANDTEGVVHVTTHWFEPDTASPAADAAIEDAVEAKLLLNDDFSSRRIALDVWGGTVVLTGVTDTQSSVSHIVETVRETPGVRSVTSYIAVDG